MKQWFSGQGDDRMQQSSWDRNQQPPDLDEMLRQLSKRLGKLFGNRSTGGHPFKQLTQTCCLLAGLAIVIWFVSGIFIVHPAEEAVITRFGRYRMTLEAGLHWLPRFIDRKYLVDVQKVSSYPYSDHMLTQDENIVLVSLAVQYRIDNLRNYLFAVDSPEGSLQQATASALRQVIGHTTLDHVLTTGRGEVRKKVREQLERTLERYQTGLVLMDVILQSVYAPDAVKAAFDDAIKAQEDEQRFVNEAQAYARKVVPIAKGKAERLLQEARAYKEERVLQAKGDVARFKALLTEYKNAPKLTKERLYLSALESVLEKTSKIILDLPQSHPFFYLPLDRWLQTADNEALPMSLEEQKSDDEMMHQELPTGVVSMPKRFTPKRLSTERNNEHRRSYP